MTDQDGLRERIADILESHAHMAMDQQACAIIDEFGMTMETALVTRAQCGLPDFIGSRVVGKWEKQ